MDKKYNKILEIVKSELSCSAHDIDHVLRVYNLCVYLSQYEKNVDSEVLLLSSLLHDIARVKEDSDTLRNIKHEVLGSEMSEQILNDEGYPKEKIEKIKHCIISHRFRGTNEPKTIEAKILFDADKLDAIGAVGIARSFIIAGEFGERLYSDVMIDEYTEDNVVENGKLKSFAKHTPNIEYELKLKKIPQRLYTTKAKEIAENRLKFMKQFFKLLKNEVNGYR